MTRAALTALTALLAAAAGPAQDPPGGRCHAPVDPAHVVLNGTGVQCGWVSLATMANRAGNPALAAAAARNPGRIRGSAEVAEFCRRHGAACECNAGDLGAFLTRHVTEGRRPVAVGVHAGTHVILVTHYEHGVRVGTVGNVPGRGEPRMWAWADFLAALRPDGMAYTLTGGK